jgi:glutathionyl-hydroquinone reductase
MDQAHGVYGKIGGGDKFAKKSYKQGLKITDGNIVVYLALVRFDIIGF